MWHYSEDTTSPIITAKKHIASGHGNNHLKLPETAVLFYMHGYEKFIQQHYKTTLLSEKFPRFLAACPIYQLEEYNKLCFLNGGRGAPQAVDTLETLAALGVKTVVTLGMFGAFSEEIENEDIIIPNKAFVEEGTSLHYYSNIEYAKPDTTLHQSAMSKIKSAKSLPIVSTDSIYRQTFFKEKLWREKGAVGVDMETSALFSVGAYLGIRVVSILIASDKHPLHEKQPSWNWTMTDELRYQFFEQCFQFATQL